MTVREELLLISELNDGMCSPEAVVDYARNPKTALHKCFEWNNSKAAENYRLWQARKVISLELTIIPSRKNDVKTRLFISLSQDRSKERGYRLITDVLGDPELREQLLTEAFTEFERMKAKYGQLKELAKVFQTIEQTRKETFAASMVE